MSNDRIKVMRIIARLNVGGPALHCIAISEALADYGFDTKLVYGSTLNSEASFPELFKIKPGKFTWVKLSRMSRISGPLADLVTLLSLIRLMRKERPQIVDTHTAKAGVLGRIAAIITGVPVIVHTFHGHVLRGYFSPIVSKAIAWIERCLAYGTTKIITPSETLKEELSSEFHVAAKTKIKVIPIGRELDAFYKCKIFKGELRKELNISSNIKIITTVGRLTAIKNQALILAACALIDPSIEWNLVIAGDGELSHELKSKAEAMGIAVKVHFLGWRPDLPKIYADTDLFVLSSDNEGNPFSLFEAFASGCASVSTCVGGVPDMFTPEQKSVPLTVTLKNEGALVPPRNEELFAEAMNKILSDDEFRKRCQKASIDAARQYDGKPMYEAIATLYQDLVRAKN